MSLYLDLKWAPTLLWTTTFEFSKIHQSKVEILQFEVSKFCSFLLVFQHFYAKIGKIRQKLLASNSNISTLGWWILENSKVVVQGRVGDHFKPYYNDMLPLITFLFNVKANFRCKNPFYFNNHCNSPWGKTWILLPLEKYFVKSIFSLIKIIMLCKLVSRNI